MPVTEDLGAQITGSNATFQTSPRVTGTLTVYLNAVPVVGVVEVDSTHIILPAPPIVGASLSAVYDPLAIAGNYCTIADIRNEGFPSSVVSDARLNQLIPLASRYVDKMTGRWFEPRTFALATPPVGWVAQKNNLAGPYVVPTQLGILAADKPFRVNGNGVRELHLEVPIIRLDFLGIENQAFTYASLTWIELSSVRVYNRHIQEGLTAGADDDRENPRIGYTVTGRIVETIASGLYPAPRIFPRGRLNIALFGVFGYTDPDPTGQNPLGITPYLISVATRRLVQRDLIMDSNICEKLNMQNLWRVTSDSEGGTSVSLSDLWLKGKFTGNSEIDSILVAFQRPAKIGIA